MMIASLTYNSLLPLLLGKESWTVSTVISGGGLWSVHRDYGPDFPSGTI